MFDLSSLKVIKGTPWSVTDTSGHKYEFNICGAVKNSACDGASDSMGRLQTLTRQIWEKTSPFFCYHNVSVRRRP